MAGYIGTTPVPQATQHRESFTATGGQTSFATAGYTPQFIDVYLNGVKLAPADFTATNGSDVVLASGATASDILEIVAYTPFEVANQTFTGTTTAANLTVTGAFTSQGIDDNANAVAITIDSSENVGIGTSSPVNVSGVPDLTVAGKFFTSDGTETNPAHSFTGDQNTGIFRPAADIFAITTNGTERMRIDSSGRVKIGTTSNTPASAGTAGIVFGDNTAGTPATGIASFAASSSAPLLLTRLGSDGNVLGIADGTTTRGTLRVVSSNLAIQGNNNLVFSTGGSNSERMRITSSGSVGIGTSSPSSLLTVHGSQPIITLSDPDTGSTSTISGNSGHLILNADSGSDASNNTIDFQVDNSQKMRLDASGNLFVGKTDTSIATQGVFFSPNYSHITSTNDTPLALSRKSSDGTILDLRKDGSTVGSIGVDAFDNYTVSSNRELIISTDRTVSRSYVLGDGGTSNGVFYPVTDNDPDLGQSGKRWKDLYLGGGVYLGGTGSANKLDDYEEGTFNVSWSGASVSPTSDLAYYTKIGRLVYWTHYTGSTTISSVTGALQLLSLPFTVKNAVNGYSVLHTTHNTFFNNVNVITGYHVINGTSAYFITSNSSTAASAAAGSGKLMMVSGLYMTDS